MRSLVLGVEDYISMKRSMGFIFGKQERCLLNFCKFMEEKKKKRITQKLATEWALGKRKMPNWSSAHKLSILRGFVVYWRSVDKKVELWPEKLWPHRYKRKNPYIYKKGEIKSIIDQCLKFNTQFGHLRPHTYYTLFGLIGSCGMRASEALRLKSSDVDLENGILTIRRTKFNKTRAIPIHASTKKILKKYSRLRRKYMPEHSSVPEFFISDRGTVIKIEAANWTFNKIALEAGIRTKSRQGPRIHDMRHTFIMNQIQEWYEQGKDVEELLPILSTYVGHSSPGSTYWYMTLTPELMSIASKKLDAYMGGLKS